MGHFLRLLVTRRWGWTLIAALIIVGGVLWGVSSPLIPYQTNQDNTSPQNEVYITKINNGDIYIWTTDKTNPTFYVARHDDFNPPIDATQIHLEAYLSFVDRSDTISVNEYLANNVHATQAHIVEQLTLYDTHSHVTGTYSTSDYNSNSEGYFDNRWWPGGSATIAVGLLVAWIALFVRRKKRGAKTPDQSDPNWPYINITPYPTTESGAKP